MHAQKGPFPYPLLIIWDKEPVIICQHSNPSRDHFPATLAVACALAQARVFLLSVSTVLGLIYSQQTKLLSVFGDTHRVFLLKACQSRWIFIKPSHVSLTVTEKPEESTLVNALNPSTGFLSLPFPALEAVFSTACALYDQPLATGWLHGLGDVGICLYCPIALLCFPGPHVPRDCSAGHGRNPTLGETTNVWILWINSVQCQWRNCGTLLR